MVAGSIPAPLTNSFTTMNRGYIVAEPSSPVTNSSHNHLRIVRPSAETGGELLELEASYAPHSPRPPEHLHPQQDERFEVLAGEFRACVGGVERMYRAGDVFEIPAGVPHWMHNVSDGVGRLNWQVRPALRSQELLETFFAMADSASTRRSKLSRFIALARLLRNFRAEFRLTRPPAPIQWLIINTLGRLNPKN